MKAVLSDICLHKGGGLQRQLYQALVERILSGRIPGGAQLPASRQWAADLGVSRNSVSAVYEQLRSEGFLASRQGSGFYVREDLHHLPKTLTPPSLARSLNAPPAKLAQAFKSAHGPHANLPFTPGLPDLDAFPIKVWNRLLHQQESRICVRGYDEPAGYLPLRRALQAYLRESRGVRCHEDQILITAGAQQGLSLIADVLLAPSDTVLIENPGYRGARGALGRLGRTLVPVPLTAQQALDIEALEHLPPARVLYCTPTHQYPMGGILEIGQRLALLDWARRTETWIIEDDYDSEFHFVGKPVAALQGLFDETPVLYVGSFSKTLMPGLRLGYLVVPDGLIDNFRQMKRFTSGESPLLTQAVTAEFMQGGHFISHLRKMRHHYHGKWQRFHHLLETHFAGRLQPVAESAGMHLVVTGEIDDLAVVQGLSELGIGSTPLSAHYVGKALQHGLVLGFANADDEAMARCVVALGKVLGAKSVDRGKT